MLSSFPSLSALMAPALMERVVLLLNHVLSREPQATARLLAHRGKVVCIQPQGLPRLLADLPTLAFQVTPAGLLEWCNQPVAVDLQVRLNAANPAAIALDALTGAMPAVEIDGDAQLATDVDWLLKNLRWDVADDLQRLFGPVVAQQLQGLGGGLSQALRRAVQTAAVAAGRMRSR